MRANRSANNSNFLFPVYRTAWTASHISLQLGFELQTTHFVPLTRDCKYKHNVLSTTNRVQTPGVLPRQDVLKTQNGVISVHREIFSSPQKKKL